MKWGVRVLSAERRGQWDLRGHKKRPQPTAHQTGSPQGTRRSFNGKFNLRTVRQVLDTGMTKAPSSLSSDLCASVPSPEKPCLSTFLNATGPHAHLLCALTQLSSSPNPDSLA